MDKAKAKQLKYLRKWVKTFKKIRRRNKKIEENKENDETRINEDGLNEYDVNLDDLDNDGPADNDN
jgi:hypothetical protein